MTHCEVHVALCLVDFVSREHFEATEELLAFPSQDTLAFRARCTVETVRTTINKLRRNGFIRTRGGTGRGNVYKYLLATFDHAPRQRRSIGPAVYDQTARQNPQNVPPKRTKTFGAKNPKQTKH
jgi:hypothetical protein